MERKPVHLIMVTELNNNKYYDMVPMGDHIEISYGRVDATKTVITKPMSEWDKIYKSKVKKGYVDRSDLVADLAVKVKPKKDKEYLPIPDKAIADLVERLQSFAQKVIDSNYKVKANQVTKAMIEQADKCITELSGCHKVPEFNKKLMELFTIIPRSMGQVQDYLASSTSDFSKIIDKEQSLLDVMRGQVVVVNLQADDDEDDGGYKNNCTILEALGIELEPTTDEDVKIIKKELGNCADKYYNSWRVRNVKNEEKFKKYCKDHKIKKSQIKLLFHGTRNENVWSILHQALRIFKRNTSNGPVINGRMLGDALYASNMPSKSLGYTSFGYWTRGSASTGYMFLNEWALGKSYDIYAFDSKFYSWDYEALKKEAPDCESLWAHSGMNTGWGALRNDEITVYNEEQVNLKYLIEVRG